MTDRPPLLPSRCARRPPARRRLPAYRGATVPDHRILHRLILNLARTSFAASVALCFLSFCFSVYTPTTTPCPSSLFGGGRPGQFYLSVVVTLLNKCPWSPEVSVVVSGSAECALAVRGWDPNAVRCCARRICALLPPVASGGPRALTDVPPAPTFLQPAYLLQVPPRIAPPSREW